MNGQPAPKSRTFALVKQALRWAIAILPFIWIFSRIDITRVPSDASLVTWWTIPVVFLFPMLMMFLQSLRWWMLLRAFAPDLSFRDCFRHFMVGGFYSLVLPTSSAQDVVRTLLVSRSVDYSVAWGAAWVHKLSGLATLIAASLLGLAMTGSSVVPPGSRNAIAAVAAVLIVFGALSFSKTLTRPVRRVLERLMPSASLLDPVARVRQGIHAYREKPVTLAVVLLITFTSECVLILGGILVVGGISGNFHAAECLLFIPAIEIILAVAAITPNGMGIREGLLALFFTRIGFTPEQIGIYVACSFVGIAVRLLGGIYVVAEHAAAKHTPTTKKDNP